MLIPEGLYLPIPGVQRLMPYVSKVKVAKVAIDEYVAKGVNVEYGEDLITIALKLSQIDLSYVGPLLINPRVMWHLENWPIAYLRMTRIYPPEHDPNHMHSLVMTSGRKFEVFAQQLVNYPELINQDIGFQAQAPRDSLPIFGIRGRVHNHIFDGHHRTTLAVWKGDRTIQCLTAYKRLF